MVTKNYLWAILLFFIDAFNGHVNGGKLFKIHLKSYMQVGVLKYPTGYGAVLPFASVTWNLTGPEGDRLNLTCPQMRVVKGTSRRILFVEEGNNTIDIGTSTYPSRVSSGNTMKVVLKTGLSWPQICCKVRLTSIEEPNSEEFGFGPQKKQTSCPCGWTNKRRITGGRGTEENEFVFAAYLRSPDSLVKYNFVCTGSIITQRHALTAAHCLADIHRLEVVVGGHDLARDGNNSGAQVIAVKEMHPHKSYDTKFHFNDIAILLLTEDINFTSLVGAVCLPSARYSLVNLWVKAVGWGSEKRFRPPSQTLRTVNLQVRAPAVCIKAYGAIEFAPHTKLCTLSHEKDTCEGDSGGPLLYYDSDLNRYVQVAVVSSGYILCGQGQPSLSTLVFPYLDWIKEVTGRIYGSSLPQQLCQKV